MKIFIALALCSCIGTALSAVIYKGIVPENELHRFEVEGKEYHLSERLYNIFQQDPVAFKDRIFDHLVGQTAILNNEKASSTSKAFNAFPQPDGSSEAKPTRPNKDTFSPTLPQQKTVFSRKIPNARAEEDKKNEDYKPVSNFALKLFKASNNESGFVISPLSPQIFLSCLAWVADGKTQKELYNVSGYQSPFELLKLTSALLSEGSKRELQIATAFFTAPELSLNRELSNALKDDVELISVEFNEPKQTGRLIKKWAESKTKGALKINEISYDPSTKIALMSALYFKGKFIFTFPPAAPGIFKNQLGEDIEVQMMKMNRKLHHGKIGDYAEWVSLPYESDDALVIILPNIGNDIDKVIENMTSQEMDEVLDGVDSELTKADVNITLPKFKLETTTNLVEVLGKMGVTTLFSPSSQLPYFSDAGNLRISNAQQQASLEVDEDGTVLVTLTNLNFISLSLDYPVPKVEFNVNRPFIAMIVDTNNRIPYVLAKITDPTKLKQ